MVIVHAHQFIPLYKNCNLLPLRAQYISINGIKKTKKNQKYGNQPNHPVYYYVRRPGQRPRIVFFFFFALPRGPSANVSNEADRFLLSPFPDENRVFESCMYTLRDHFRVWYTRFFRLVQLWSTIILTDCTRQSINISVKPSTAVYRGVFAAVSFRRFYTKTHRLDDACARARFYLPSPPRRHTEISSSSQNRF